jgi:hypothetical protein
MAFELIVTIAIRLALVFVIIKIAGEICGCSRK